LKSLYTQTKQVFRRQFQEGISVKQLILSISVSKFCSHLSAS
jgi:hypothetical protein